ncbi:hypothetical protein Hanom_Chr04g00320051 [Helianthus anomalus]
MLNFNVLLLGCLYVFWLICYTIVKLLHSNMSCGSMTHWLPIIMSYSLVSPES